MMKAWVRIYTVLLLQLLGVCAVEMKVDESRRNQQVCSGMYSRKSWGGNIDPFILVKFVKPDDLPETEDPIVSLVVFEWSDRPLIGATVPTEDGQGTKEVFLCDEASRDAKLCEDSNLGEFIVSPNATTASNALIRTEAIHLKEPGAINYPIKRTGYYCVSTTGYSTEKYMGIVEFRNAFGELPAAQIAKLPFYAGITLIYAFLAMGWGVLYWMNRSDILAVQNYITAILCFLVVEMFITWLFYDFQNRHGLNAGAKALLIVVSVLSAARNSFSFFLLLIVCMGYGVVKHTLGRAMHWARALAITHFVFGIIYAVAFLATTPEDTGPIVLFVVLPLAGTLTAFYIWTLNSLNYTMKDLVERKQHVKAGMYRKLWWCILASIVVIFVFFFVNSWTFAGQTGSTADFVPKHWQTRWFILDGWLNLVYFADVAFIAYVWRPTVNNRRFAMSDEIAQDDDGFEIASMRSSMDLEDVDLEGNPSKPPAYDPAPRSGAGGSSRTANPMRDASPLPAPQPTKPTAPVLGRESLDGETIFALGDEGGFTDDESEDEGRRLTGKKE
ncbi:ER membrane protein [Zymoseptoria tritici IPO323]|uniref:ER membrane protein n=3 Tax=Zymoseptoria tritici TaxID=1047171 RepID=F9X362_ZYMTI|nr:ER membrane protein [Zymoseptoria tritici IPO323]EGP90315.1 ER membrane protein [Zymoseptoria tritici IPO323]